MENKFIVIVPAYKVAKWIALNINLIKMQSYTNFECWIIDDGSHDGTEEITLNAIKNDSRFNYIKNETRIGSSLQNYYTAFNKANPADNDIIVWLDGDDWFSSVFVLDYLNKFYNIYDCWMTYGTYQSYPAGREGSHHCVEVPDEIHLNKSYRKWHHVYSHLRTHRAFLFKELDKESLIDNRTGKFYTEATDCAYLFSMAELCGNKERIKLIDDILVILNRSNPNQAAGNLKKQKDTEQHIRKQTPYKSLENIII
jgi:glycosyltransferase involved in cell wall biosynthesis